ncbi:DUF1852 domain-containing protein [Polymorphobacter sp. PAMC 29334]|uniref:DUF1852 domain-containing protein n=1 Tax=Polymorphobacter sp. PAMC 29334 TaxID=2862331 RepID=UPI001C67DF16|nr:DUF1852 domain-containing protein [Polymorphobacter sp. PAMC 29334]QYE33752.1 DUF1852 domain-containing protein [Polymorphobacter sp. PAMC 29334]
MPTVFAFSINRIAFDENYRPADNTRITTNFANLARGVSRRENLRNTLRMIDNRFNSLAHWDNPRGDRYTVELEIVSVELRIDAEGRDDVFPLIEILQTKIVDRKTEERIDGIVGNNFSSYVRDYDFNVLLSEHQKTHPGSGDPQGFGDLHGNLFKHFLNSSDYRECFCKPPVICLSVSSSKTYHRTTNKHPILGFEYRNDEFSATDAYFAKMGMKVRYFMPPNSVAPFAFYHLGDLIGDYTNLELVSTVSVMETFQKIYRPEIYNANSAAAERYQPSLKYQDFSLTRIVYDREERSRLAVEQGKFTEERLIKPYQTALEQWSASLAL